MKRLLFAFLTLFALVRVTTAQDVTFDFSGTFPPNETVTPLTAPSASFLLEVTVAQSAPATPPNGPLFVDTPVLHGSYSFKGQTYPSTSPSNYFFSNSGGNVEGFTLNTRFGKISLEGMPLFHTPNLITRTGTNTVRFLTTDFGAGTHWAVLFTPTTGGASANQLINLTEIVSRPVSH
jgi:hypothetical protein